MSERAIPEYLQQDMVERVARALARLRVEQNLRIDEFRGGEPITPERIEIAIGYAWKDFAAEARVAVFAMREPNLAMRKVCSFEEAEITWPAMIDAALSKSTPTQEGEIGCLVPASATARSRD